MIIWPSWKSLSATRISVPLDPQPAKDWIPSPWPNNPRAFGVRRAPFGPGDVVGIEDKPWSSRIQPGTLAFRVDAVGAMWLPDVSEDEAKEFGVEAALVHRGWNRDGSIPGGLSYLAMLEDNLTADGHDWDQWIWTYTGEVIPAEEK